MGNKGLYVSQKDIRRYELLEKVLDESLTLAVAAAALGVSYRQALRLKARVKAYGLEGLARPRFSGHLECKDDTTGSRCERCESNGSSRTSSS